MSSPNFHTNSLYFNHSSPYKLLYYAWVTCDYISREISPRNWFQCFPVYSRCRSGSGSVSVSGSVSGFRIPDFRVFHTPLGILQFSQFEYLVNTYCCHFNTKVAILDVQREKGCQLEEKLKRHYGSGKVIFISCDVTSKFQMKGE